MNTHRPLLVAAALAALVATAAAQDFRYPPETKVIDVTAAPYNAVGDGKTDVTAALQKAFDDHDNQGAVIYLPAGTYLVRDTIRWPKGRRGGMEYKNTILEGQGRDKTVLRLADACPGFTDPAKPKALIWTGNAPAQRFRNAVRRITLDVGQGNPGAIAAQFNASNQGTMTDVLLRAADASGTPDAAPPVGLDMAFTDEIGPLLIRDVEVTGFAVGVKCGHAVNSMTMERVTLRGQSTAGLLNQGQVLSVRGLKTFLRPDVPAVINTRGPGFLTLIDSVLTADGPGEKGPAIRSETYLFARNVKTPGYGPAIRAVTGKKESPETNDIPGPEIAEHVGSPVLSLFPGAPAKSLNLPVAESPEVPWDDPKEWQSVTAHGAGGNDYNNRKRNDDTPAFQKAIDAATGTVILPHGFYVLNDTVVIRGKVRRIVGFEATIVGGEGFKGTDKPLFRFEDGDAASPREVVIERINETYGSRAKTFLEHAAPKRTLAIRNAIIGRYEGRGGGRVFLDDVCGGPFLFTKQEAWCRQLNQEAQGLHVANRGGSLWVLGYKTERGGILIDTTDGGRTEVLGGFSYTTTDPKDDPMFACTDSTVSVRMADTCFSGKPYRTLVRETRGGETKTLAYKDAPSRYGIGRVLPLYVSGPAPAAEGK
jgi:hypothetical protein